MARKRQLLIITGFSGSGKSAALRQIENLGFYCVDNLPAALMADFGDLIRSSPQLTRIAIVMDARGHGFLHHLDKGLEALRKSCQVKVVFLSTTLTAITQRFKESRLRHPLSLKGTIRAGYQREERLLSPLRQQADLVIDTSRINVHALKTILRKILAADLSMRLEIHFMSFGFKYGVPPEADLVLDVRFLKNPYFEPRLKHATGLSPGVKKFVLGDKKTHEYLRRTGSYLEYVLKRYQEEGKTLATIALGCTGGMHRSVVLVEAMAAHFKNHWHVKSLHRDLGK